MPANRVSPPLSVVIPTHDTRDLTLEAVASAATECPDDTEIIVVDDGSTDGTADAVAASFPKTVVLVSDTARGFSRAANRGLAKAHGDLRLLLNSDATIDDGAIRPLLKAFADDPALGVAGAALRYPDGSPQWSGGSFPTLGWLFALTSGGADLLRSIPAYDVRRRPGSDPAGPVDWVTGAAMAVRREAWRVLGPLDEGYAFYAQDLDYCRRASNAGWKVAVAPGFGVTHHLGATITGGKGAALPDRPEILWSDLVRYFSIHEGRRAAQRARKIMIIGARLRVTGLALSATFGGRAERVRRRLLIKTFRRAISQL